MARLPGYLKRDPLLYVNLTQALERDLAETVAASKEGILLKDKTSETYMLSARTNDTALALLEKCADAQLLMASESFYLEEITTRMRLKLLMDCRQASYQKKEKLPVKETGAILRPLQKEHALFMQQNYTLGVELSYIQQQIETGVAFGAFYGNELAGFIGMHSEGSLGLLEVMPAYRGRGIGSALQAYAANKLLEEGYIPFAQIEKENRPSLRLQKSLGFSLTNRLVYWYTAADYTGFTKNNLEEIK